MQGPCKEVLTLQYFFCFFYACGGGYRIGSILAWIHWILLSWLFTVAPKVAPRKDVGF